MPFGQPFRRPPVPGLLSPGADDSGAEPNQWGQLLPFLVNEFPGLLETKVRSMPWLPPAGAASEVASSVNQGLSDFARDNLSIDTLRTPEGAFNAASMAMTGGLFSPVRGGALAAGSIRASHASPHNFDKFEWSPRTRGTGEGHQALADGLYLGESPGLIEDYYKKFARIVDVPEQSRVRRYSDARENYYNKFGEKFSPFPQEEWAFLKKRAAEIDSTLAEDAKYRELMLSKLSDKEFGEGIKGAVRNVLNKRAARAEEILAEKSDIEMRLSHIVAPPKPLPTRYDVEIDAAPDDLLDWDIPIKDQPSRVSSILKTMGYSDENLTGQQIHNMLRLEHGKVEAAETLKKAGFKGIRYFDQLSRDKKSGTSNYVIFDPEIIKIIKKYGIAGLLAGAGAGTAEATE